MKTEPGGCHLADYNHLCPQKTQEEDNATMATFYMRCGRLLNNVNPSLVCTPHCMHTHIVSVQCNCQLKTV